MSGSGNRPDSERLPSGALEVKVRLLVLGFHCEAEEITSILGVLPSRTWKVGDPVVPNAQIRQKENAWVLVSPVDPLNVSVDKAVSALLAALPDPGAFARLPNDSDIQLTCTIYGHSERPFLYLSRETLNAVAAIGAALDVDVYDLSAGGAD